MLKALSAVWTMVKDSQPHEWSTKLDVSTCATELYYIQS